MVYACFGSVSRLRSDACGLRLVMLCQGAHHPDSAVAFGATLTTGDGRRVAIRADEDWCIAPVMYNIERRDCLGFVAMFALFEGRVAMSTRGTALVVYSCCPWPCYA